MTPVQKTGFALLPGAACMFFGTAAHAQRISSLSGIELGDLCRKESKRAACGSYLAGVVDGAAWSQSFGALVGARPATAFCLPAGIKGIQVRSLVVGWLVMRRQQASLLAVPCIRPCMITMPAPPGWPACMLSSVLRPRIFPLYRAVAWSPCARMRAGCWLVMAIWPGQWTAKSGRATIPRLRAYIRRWPSAFRRKSGGHSSVLWWSAGMLAMKTP